MKKLSPNQKYSIDEIAEKLNLSKILASVIRKNFGDPISIHELKQINWGEFVACKYLGRKRWYELQEALSAFDFPESAVTFIRKRGLKNIIIEIDVSKPFEKVIQDLAIILDKIV
jgi:hypothetical protein